MLVKAARIFRRDSGFWDALWRVINRWDDGCLYPQLSGNDRNDLEFCNDSRR